MVGSSIAEIDIPAMWDRQPLKANIEGQADKLRGGNMNGHSSPLKVIVVGAGIGGIACAVECKRRGYEVSMFDAVKV